MEDLYIVAIGASAGGTEVVSHILDKIPENSGAAFVVIRHLLRDQPSHYESILKRQIRLKVETVKDGEPVKPDHVYLMPETHSLIIKNKRLFLQPRKESEKINKTIDKFLESLAEDVKEKAIGVILSGYLDDGTAGAQAIYRYGGKMIVQAPETANAPAMPKSAIKHDHPYSILPPDQIPEEILKITQGKIAGNKR